MSELDKEFTDSIADIYDTHLVPLIFECYADDLATRAGSFDPRSVLEVAAGSGVATRAVAPALNPAARYVATDLNPPMLDRAVAMQADPDRIEWRPADALDLPFEDDEFDFALCQFSVMFFPDRIAAYREARRVVRPGGTFVFNMWDRIEENDFADVVTDSLAELYPENPPRFLARTPHGHYDPNVYVSELRQAGFTSISVDPMDEMSQADSPDKPSVAYCMGTPLRNEIEAQNTYSLDEATAYATAAIADTFGAGDVEGRIRGFVVTAN